MVQIYRWVVLLFQSRNRGSFDFKENRQLQQETPGASFNLVIEVLLISSHTVSLDALQAILFQSRNRGSFDFKLVQVENLCRPQPEGFQSRNRGSFDFKVLFAITEQKRVQFQSRNRGSFDFKRQHPCASERIEFVVSIS